MMSIRGLRRTGLVLPSCVWAVLCLLCIGSSARADDFQLGRRVIVVEAPEGFSRLTPDMGAAYDMLSLFEDDLNETLAVYVPTEEAIAARDGEIPSMDRYFLLKVNKTLKSQEVSDSDFAALKQVMQTSRDDMLRDLTRQFPDLMEGTQQKMSEALALEVTASVGAMVPVDWETSTKDTYGFAMFLSYDWQFGEDSLESVVAATSVFALVKNRVLFLYGYGEPTDMEWTQAATVDWAASVQESNQSARASRPASSRAPGGAPSSRSPTLSAPAAGTILGLVVLIGVVGWKLSRSGQA